MLPPLDTCDVFALSKVHIRGPQLLTLLGIRKGGGVDSGEIDQKYTEAELCRLTLVSESLMKFYEVT